MIQAHFEGDEIIYTGIVSEGDVYPDLCCVGWGWEVAVIFLASYRGNQSIWGVCENPDCPEYQADIGPDDAYRGVSSILQDDLAEWLAGQQPHAAQLRAGG
jgi:hypothetical protein